MAAHPRRRTPDVDELSESFQDDRPKPGGRLVLGLVPVQRRRVDAVAVPQDLRPADQRAQPGVRVFGPKVAEHGLQGAVVAQVARAEQPEHPHPHAHVNLPSRPATMVFTVCTSDAVGARSSTRSPERACARLVSQEARWR